ncbi:unnamed protein product [Lupinus luteus]|uniref:Uncharacterized protein n=1 Tax=Lupinus luteus TaxID=3873 RepID=A0AAV1W0X3_LUPLU
MQAPKGRFKRDPDGIQTEFQATDPTEMGLRVVLVELERIYELMLERLREKMVWDFAFGLRRTLVILVTRKVVKEEASPCVMELELENTFMLMLMLMIMFVTTRKIIFIFNAQKC